MYSMPMTKSPDDACAPALSVRSSTVAAVAEAGSCTRPWVAAAIASEKLAKHCTAGAAAPSVAGLPHGVATVLVMQSDARGDGSPLRCAGSGRSRASSATQPPKPTAVRSVSDDCHNLIFLIWYPLAFQ